MIDHHGWRAAIERLNGTDADQALRPYRSDSGIFEAWWTVR
jgi:hypothetical protein